MPTRAGYYSKNLTFFDGSSGNSSEHTSEWHRVGDYAIMSIDWSEGGNSRLTLWGSNVSGFNVALPAKNSVTATSVISGIGAAGIFSIDPGVMWMRATRHISDDSLAPATLNART